MHYRPKLTEETRATLWRLWHQGRSLHHIARTVQIKPPSVYLFLQKHGGIEPPRRRRAARALSVHEREEISRGLGAGKSQRQIARELGRNPSTISREIARNGGAEHYRAQRADEAAWDRARRPKRCRLAREHELCELVAEKLALKWSPEQISGYLRERYPDEPLMQLSHETIYRTLFIQSRGALKKELRDHLRTKRRFRQSRHKSGKGQRRGGPIVGAISIRERPAEVEDRAVPGHWEGDLIEGEKGTYIATLVERKTRYVILARIGSKRTEEVTEALVREMGRLPEQLRKTLTWDRGSELAAHTAFTLASEIEVYFCDPYSPWQRGSNENTNGLLRQYFPKGSDLSYHTQAELWKVAEQLNGRPRKTLGFKTPAEMLEKELEQAGVATTG